MLSCALLALQSDGVVGAATCVAHMEPPCFHRDRALEANSGCAPQQRCFVAGVQQRTCWRQRQLQGSVPVVDPSLQRGFWAVLPGGNLSVLGAYLQVCWLRGGAAAAACSCLIFSAQELVAGAAGVRAPHAGHYPAVALGELSSDQDPATRVLPPQPLTPRGERSRHPAGDPYGALTQNHRHCRPPGGGHTGRPCRRGERGSG